MHGVEREPIPRFMEVISTTTATQLRGELLSVSAIYARVTLAQLAYDTAYDETGIIVRRVSQNRRMFEIMISGYRMAGQNRRARAMAQLRNTCHHISDPRQNSIIRHVLMLKREASEATQEADDEEDRISSLL